MKKFKRTLSFSIIGAFILLIVLFGVIVSIIGYFKFTDSLTSEYNDSAFHTAETAAVLVNGDRIDEYLALQNEEDDAEYYESMQRMDVLCQKQGVTMIYVIAVDTSDYNNYYSVFDALNESSEFTPWKVGSKQKANDEYKQIYKDMYENGLERATVFRTTNLNGYVPHVTSLIPIKNSQNETKAILCVQRPMSELNSGRRTYLIWVAASASILAVIVSVAAAIHIKKQIINPFKKITSESERFASENSRPDKPISEKISRISDITELAESIENMENKTLLYFESMNAATAEKERIGAELDIASRIQSDMMPSDFPAFPDRKEFSIFASMSTAKEVGGDFYDFFLIDDDHIAMVMADVSGKGVPAALFMVVSKVIINNFTLMNKKNPAIILRDVNEVLYKNNKPEMFVTVWLGILEISSGKLTAANAGHEYPVIKRGDNGFELYKDKHGFVIGGMEGVKYKSYELMLESGDTIFLYTDGVTEAINVNSEMFGTQRLIDALNIDRDAQPEVIVDNVKRQIGVFVGPADQFDDMTMMALRYAGPEDKNGITVEATLANSDAVLNFINTRLERMGCPDEVRDKIDVAVDELYSNIAQFAYRGTKGKTTVRIESAEDPNGAVITFIDNGSKYDPLSAKNDDVALSADERENGGLGVYLVKKSMDAVSYKYLNGQNIIKFRKNFQQ